MTYYDYKVVPAPSRAKKVKGVRAAPELFAMTLTEAINEVARQGWEYVRAESMPAEAPGGLFRRGVATDQTVLVFRRPREHLSPRLAAVASEPAPTRRTSADENASPIRAERARADHTQQGGVLRREPGIRGQPRPVEDQNDMSAHSAPRLGPAEKS